MRYINTAAIRSSNSFFIYLNSGPLPTSATAPIPRGSPTGLKNPDTYEPYPNAPKSFAQNILTFCNDELRAHWHSSAGGSEGRRLVYVTTLRDNRQDGEYKSRRTLRVLHQLFPSISDSIPHIITLALLVQTIVDYRHPDFNQEPRNEYLKEYMRDISGYLHEPREVEIVTALGRLDVLLENLCLCELEPLSSESPITRTFGFSTVPLQCGDAMIPLWLTEDLTEDVSPSVKYDLRKPGQLTTMLAVRCDEGQQLPLHKNRNSGQETLRRKGRIIGPAVCITSDTVFGNDTKRHINADHSCGDTTKQFSMLLY
ncbi:hypothetical protein FLAG1_12109 [Fusarium langsethiae]|uniref:Uncharacterized protein n=1 Tax=Fusarium langsethiae TaxID=179993 RepID=A0A0M9ELP4_FUSLA|nr:hypothetical protein FLAG1_12109 [Fusarium langsethiae]